MLRVVKQCTAREDGGLAVEATRLLVVIVMLLGAGAFSLGASRVSQAIIQAHHISKLAALGHWHTEMLTPGLSGAALEARLRAVAAGAETVMTAQVAPILDHGCGAGAGGTDITNEDDIGTSGSDTFAWAETVTDVLSRDYSVWTNFPVLRVRTYCDVRLGEMAGVPLPGEWQWSLAVTSFVPLDCYRSAAQTSTRLCG